MSKLVPLNNVNRNIVRLTNKSDENNFVDASPAELFSFVWELTKEVYSLSGKDVEQRLQRNVTKLIRKQG
ncbi:MAG: hypothetical protein PHF37_02290 [Phycisphaerae bacterium]|nr:hypothetical protein [Phycisphaerae bacterium]